MAHRWISEKEKLDAKKYISLKLRNDLCFQGLRWTSLRVLLDGKGILFI